jgi:anti-sigma factor RsiW
MRQLSRPETCLSDLSLDEWASGELDAADRERVTEHLADCARCRGRRDELERERATFYAAAPSWQSHALRAIPKRRAVLRQVAFAATLAALAALVAVAVVPGREPYTQQKGGPSIGYFVKRDERVLLGDSATRLQPGDLLRFTYSSEQARYLALFSRDSRTASVYFPTGTRAVRVPAGREVALDFSVQLDDAPGDESVHGLFCAESFELEPLRAALAASGQLPVTGACRLHTLTLRKAPAR